MARRILAIGTVLIGTCALLVGTPALADRHDDGHPQLRGAVASVRHASKNDRHRDTRRLRALRPEMPYRGPHFAGPRRGPDFLIHAYLPRLTDKPIYNEPPSRFPTY